MRQCTCKSCGCKARGYNGRGSIRDGFAPLASMADIRVQFGKAVRRLRKDQDFSQEGFAAEAKINRAYMGKIERGEVNISIDNINKIAQALGLTAGKLMVEADREDRSRG